MRLIPLLLIPTMLLSQSGELSEAARKLSRKARTGNAQLTWRDGRKKTGEILRVTDQFATFRAGSPMSSCENVELSAIGGVHWLRTPYSGMTPGMVIAFPFVFAFILPAALVDSISNHLKSPPLRTLQGTWESGATHTGGVKSSLEFSGFIVRDRRTIVKKGRYSVIRDQLHMTFEGESESVMPVRFDCLELILPAPEGALSLGSDSRRVAAPIVGMWQGKHESLEFKRDGAVEERKEEVRSGVFERTATGVKIRWADAHAPDGPEWNGEIKHRHIVFRAGAVVREYRYAWPGMDL